MQVFQCDYCGSYASITDAIESWRVERTGTGAPVEVSGPLSPAVRWPNGVLDLNDDGEPHRPLHFRAPMTAYVYQGVAVCSRYCAERVNEIRVSR